MNTEDNTEVVARREREALATIDSPEFAGRMICYAMNPTDEYAGIVAHIDAWGKRRAAIASAPAPVADAERINVLETALSFYANGEHFTRHDESAWDTVSGEPSNFYEDESNTATVEDGTVARMALEGTPLSDDAAPAPKTAALTTEQIEQIAREHGTGGWQTLNDMIKFARAIEQHLTGGA